MDQAQKGLNAAAAADRILEALLSVQDSDERLSMVPDAFVPPSMESEAVPSFSFAVVLCCAMITYSKILLSSCTATPCQA